MQSMEAHTAPPGSLPGGSDARRFRFQGGKIYFSRRTERQVYFGFTIFIAVLGLLSRFGWLG